MLSLLIVLSVLFGAVVKLRNKLFDKGVLHSDKFDLPVVCLGNLTVGGTGKTPHTEYLIGLLKDTFRIAMLSRGYKRKTKGFVLANEHSTVADIGDEPLQVHKKFPDIVVAVQEKRTYGIRHLLRLYPQLDAVILDDAFQHRRVLPSLSILMMDYHRPVCDDRLLPLGSLREHASGMARADIVIVSKCPPQLDEQKRQQLRDKLALSPRQQLFFTTFEYSPLQAVFPEACKTPILRTEDLQLSHRPVMSFCGIASPAPFVSFVQGLYQEAKNLKFSDHHTYTAADAERIRQQFQEINSQNGLIITTEKDYYHLLSSPYFDDLAPYLYYVKLEVRFVDGQQDLFNQLIINHVQSYPRNRIVAKRRRFIKASNRRYIRVRAGKFGRKRGHLPPDSL